MEIDEQRDWTEPSTYNLLFICTGNTCRSPMAEAVARHEIVRRGWKHVRVASAGVAAAPGMPASSAAIEVASGMGLDLVAHRSRPLDPKLIEWADLILAMSPSHISVLDAMGAIEKSALLGDFAAGGTGIGAPVSDPYGGDVNTYRTTLVELDRLVGLSLDRITAIVNP